ncbi:Uncharacterised protein [uncultured archaeon]|nr:Uncharacterised protein [uncultured archaeon]
MAKFLTLWEIDTTKLPEKPEEQMSLYTKLMDMLKEDIESRHKMDWGEFVNVNEGYSIYEGTEQEVWLSLVKYTPYLKFKVHPVLSYEQVIENMKKLSHA